jgi:hypothetical protein
MMTMEEKEKQLEINEIWITNSKTEQSNIRVVGVWTRDVDVRILWRVLFSFIIRIESFLLLCKNVCISFEHEFNN